jgi:3',5'-nucleoside bisphosphate phosphatase
MKYLCDFHLHSCLSPCGALDMSPAAIARAAKAAGLDAIALADHNSARNAPAFAAACRREKLFALYGMEICAAEDIHCLALFETPDAALAFGAFLYARLPDVPNIPEKWGDQVVVDDRDQVLEIVPRYLGNATDIPFGDLPALVAGRGGLFIPAHIDRTACGLLAQFGLLPPESGPILEVTRHRVREMQDLCGADHTLVTFSDSHHLADIGRAATEIEADAFTLPALRAALLARRALPVV